MTASRTITRLRSLDDVTTAAPTNGQVPVWDAALGKFVWGAGGGGGAPTGPAGGDLAGTYPDPTIAAGSVNSSKILDGSIAVADLAFDPATQTELDTEAAARAAHAALTTTAHGGIVASSDARLTDQRVPSDGSVTAVKVAGSLKPSGSAAAADEALRALGAGSTMAAAGDDSRFPTAGQKNALPGTSGTPGTANRYVTDQDTRLSDARAATAHAVSHADGGTDEITTGLDPRAYPMLAGTVAARPAAGVAGRFYWASDEHILYRDDGAAWAKAAVADYDDLSSIPASFAPAAHATSHQPGGSDAMAVDAAAATGSLRTLGTGAAQAAPGNDARLSDQRTPTDSSVTDAKVAAGAAIAKSKLAALAIVNADVDAAAAIAESKLNLASDAAAGTASRRTLGTGAAQAAAGNDARLSDARTPTAHASTHSPGGSDAIDWAGAIHMRGTLAARPAAAAGNAGLFYFATDQNGGTVYRSTGSAWEQVAKGVSEAPSGAAGGDLTGTYPNPTVAALAVTDAKVAAANKDGAAATASMRTLGTGAAQAAAGNDSRLSDSRTPTAHAATHKTGGSDAVKLDELAAPTDVTTLNASTSAHGLLRKLSNAATDYLDGTGAWSTPTATLTPAQLAPNRLFLVRNVCKR